MNRIQSPQKANGAWSISVDNYDYQERIAIMQDSHIPESEAFKLLDKLKWQAAIDRMKSMPKHIKQVEVRVPKREPIFDRKTMATGEHDE